jgi:hypothetical protein
VPARYADTFGMVYLFNTVAKTPARPVPQRRRTIIIGAGLTGIAAAYHLGEHSLLLERRAALAESHDHSFDLSLGPARSNALGHQDAVEEAHRSGASEAKRKTLSIAGSSVGATPPGTRDLIHVARWEPPELLASSRRDQPTSIRALLALLRGEIVFGANVVRVSPSLRKVELADGRQFVYDKLLCTVPLAELTGMVAHELTSWISHEESLRFWLNEHDIELADSATQFREGDVDEIAAGKRVATHIHRALASRFQTRHWSRRSPGHNELRLVSSAAPATP